MLVISDADTEAEAPINMPLPLSELEAYLEA
jgi:hypothetical protein